MLTSACLHPLFFDDEDDDGGGYDIADNRSLLACRYFVSENKLILMVIFLVQLVVMTTFYNYIIQFTNKFRNIKMLLMRMNFIRVGIDGPMESWMDGWVGA